MPDAAEAHGMSSERSTGGTGGHETSALRTTDEAIERQLRAALDVADEEETRFHLRQALQLVAALDER
jgi:hypothetical protein